MVIKNVPLARQIVQEILSGIASGTLARENGALPSEAELSQRFDVSRATIREALSQLEERGIVIRRQGVGTFVAPTPRIDAGLEELESLETLARRIGLETRMGHPTIEERTATPGEADCLQAPAGTPVLTIARVILTAARPTERRSTERPIAYLVDIVPTSILRREDLDQTFRGSVLDLLVRRGDFSLSHSRTDISVASADKVIARALKLQEGEPLHKLEAQLYTRDGRIVDYSTSYFVPGYFHFHVIRRIGQMSGALASS